MNNVTPLPCGVRRFALEEIPAEPWRNGGGWTRTVAASGRGDEMDWRVSAADITRAGAFSLFAGMDRTAVLIRGERLELSGGAEPIIFTEAGHVARFSGDTPMHARTPVDAARLWNVMARRGRAQARVEVLRDVPLTLVPGRVAMVLVLDGQYQLSDHAGPLCQLEAGEGLTLDGFRGRFELRPEHAGSSLIHTQLSSEPPSDT